MATNANAALGSIVLVRPPICSLRDREPSVILRTRSLNSLITRRRLSH
jgi:hypothetical protein